MLLAISLVCACSSGTKLEAGARVPASLHAEARSRAAAVSKGVRKLDVGVAHSHELTTLTRKTLGPFLAFGASGGLAAWAANSEQGDGLALTVTPLAPDGAPVGQSRPVARIPHDTSSLVIRPADAAGTGWLSGWAALLDRGEAVSVLAVASDGSARGEPLDVQRTSEHVAWVDLVPIPEGAICIWAEETPSGDATILAAPLGPTGKARGLAVRVAAGVRRWQAVRSQQGAALALVQPDAGGERLALYALDSEGHPVAAPRVIASAPNFATDVEVAPWQSGWVFAWTDRRGPDPRVMVAALDDHGLTAAAPVIDESDSSTLLALSGGPGGVALAWEAATHRRRETRVVHLGLVVRGNAPSAPLSLRPGASLELSSASAPQLVTTENGFALLGTARVCGVRSEAAADTEESGERADDRCVAPWVPTFVRLNGQLVPEQTEPFVVNSEGGAAVVGWDLACASPDRCVALAATGDTPTPIFTMDLRARRAPFNAPLPRSVAPNAPRALGVVTLASSPMIDEVAATSPAAAHIVATLGGRKRLRSDRRELHLDAARVRLLTAGDGGEVRSNALISTAASPTGRIALAQAASPSEGALVGWVSSEEEGRRVHLGRIDAHGRLVRETRLAMHDSVPSEVAAAASPRGWIIAWISAESHASEVHALVVDLDLRPVAPEQRLARSRGDVADLTLTSSTDAAWVAYSDSRDSPTEGNGDIFAVPLRVADASASGPEVRLLATARHSRSPQLLPVEGGGVLVAWIEDAPPGLDGPSAAMAARLDSTGRLVKPAEPLPLADPGRPVAIVFQSNLVKGHVGESNLGKGGPDAGVRAVVARAAGAGLTLDALRMSVSLGDATASTLLDLDAPADFQVALALDGDTLVFSDVGPSSSGVRVRRANVQWAR